MGVPRVQSRIRLTQHRVVDYFFVVATTEYFTILTHRELFVNLCTRVPWQNDYIMGMVIFAPTLVYSVPSDLTKGSSAISRSIKCDRCGVLPFSGIPSNAT